MKTTETQAIPVTARTLNPQLLVVDNFLSNPDQVREIALKQHFVQMHSAGLRTKEQFLHLAPYKEEFERLLGCEVINWDDNDANGRFQCCFAENKIPYHSDSQSMAGVLFLTPNAPVNAGLSLLRSKRSGLRRRIKDDALMKATFGDGAEFDADRWEVIDQVGNIYNRLVLFDAYLCHGASAYFGSSLSDGRLFQNFFFNVV
ncbi:MAG: hypothetical protein IPP34_11575 [Bacteroidetes bacterium]|nr:hypothetical protein [Bacteroidota bacterium]MBK8416961.1 hypothetical protein [Bacteroidota bacterium]MBK9046679.1 hypothetical protein [Bacteroidota bacterium]MBL0072399.1 hypothetical protein [Bacteroidota bacterium]